MLDSVCFSAIQENCDVPNTRSIWPDKYLKSAFVRSFSRKITTMRYRFWHCKQKTTRKQTFRLWKSLYWSSSTNSLLKFKNEVSLFICDFLLLKKYWRFWKLFPLSNHWSRFLLSHLLILRIDVWFSPWVTEKLLNCSSRQRAMENNETLLKG